MHLRPYGPDTLLLLWEYWHGDWPVGSPPDLTPSFDVEMFPEVCVRGLQTMVPGLGSYLGNIPRSTIVDGGYYTETPELLPLVGPVGGEGLEGAWLCGGLAGYGVMAANVSRAIIAWIWVAFFPECQQSSCGQGAGELVAQHIVGSELPSYAEALLPGRYARPEYAEAMAEMMKGDGGAI